MRKKTKDEYIGELKIKNPNVILLGDYVDANTKTRHRCLIHNVEWDVTPSRALHGVGCDVCHSERIKQSKTLTHDEYVAMLREKNPYVRPMSNYIDAKTLIPHKCLIHDLVWDSSPTNILAGHRCPKCGVERNTLTRTKTNSEFVSQLKNINSNITPIEEYVNSSVPILFKCNIDGYEWKTTPAMVLSGTGCPKCGGKLKLTHEDFIKRMSDKKPEIAVIGEYKNARTHIRCKCKKCEHEWSVVPYSVLNNVGCPKCNHGISKGELKIESWLKDNNIEFIQQKRFDECKDKLSLPFDFYLSEQNIAIEFDGEQHTRSVDYFGGEEMFRKLQEHDKIKTLYCEEHGITLIRIVYNSNIEEILYNNLIA